LRENALHNCLRLSLGQALLGCDLVCDLVGRGHGLASCVIGECAHDNDNAAIRKVRSGAVDVNPQKIFSNASFVPDVAAFYVGVLSRYPLRRLLRSSRSTALPASSIWSKVCIMDWPDVPMRPQWR